MARDCSHYRPTDYFPCVICFLSAVFTCFPDESIISYFLHPLCPISNSTWYGPYTRSFESYFFGVFARTHTHIHVQTARVWVQTSACPSQNALRTFALIQTECFEKISIIRNSAAVSGLHGKGILPQRVLNLVLNRS